MFYYRNSSMVQYKKGLYIFKTIFLGGFGHFPSQNCLKHTFFFRPLTSDFADKMSIIAKRKEKNCLKKTKSQLCLYEENTIRYSLCWCLEKGAKLFFKHNFFPNWSWAPPAHYEILTFLFFFLFCRNFSNKKNKKILTLGLNPPRLEKVYI